jgi:putative oxygen-independent coproporphyrinogen III oxidase
MPSASSLLVALPEDWENGGFALYLHWPFCQSKCPYCDFNSHVAAEIDQARWERAYLAEIDRVAGLTSGRVLRSVFFGGGTPSLMHPDLVAAILERIRRGWRTSNSFEVTLEANPTSVEAGRFAGYRDAGVNRISMGIQSLNESDLKALGRLHSAAEALEAFEIARRLFDRVSFDLIYARQDQSLAAWREELGRALSLAVDHLSLYQLTIEDGTAFGTRAAAGKLRGLPDEDLAADLYEATQELCENAGFPAYEVSNHAKTGAQSLHNRVYWEYGDYAGIGPGAHGRLTLDGIRYATDMPRLPGAWLERVEAHGSGGLSSEALTPEEQFSEFLLMGLRLREGVDLARLDHLKPAEFAMNYNGLIDSGHLEIADGRLRTSVLGRPVLNAILREILGA